MSWYPLLLQEKACQNAADAVLAGLETRLSGLSTAQGVAYSFSTGNLTGICGPACTFLADPGGDAGVLRHPDPGGEDLVLS